MTSAATAAAAVTRDSPKRRAQTRPMVTSPATAEAITHASPPPWVRPSYSCGASSRMTGSAPSAIAPAATVGAERAAPEGLLQLEVADAPRVRREVNGS